MILLQESAAAAGSPMGSWIMIIALIAIFYFFMIRPQQKQRKKLQKERDAMKKGDRVITAGGIHARILEIDPEKSAVMLEVAPGVKIKVEKTMIYPSAEDAQADAANAVNAEQPK